MTTALKAIHRSPLAGTVRFAIENDDVPGVVVVVVQAVAPDVVPQLTLWKAA